MKRLCVDFDGVLHSYTSPWAGASVVQDPPVDGAISFLVQAITRFSVAIFSSRNKQDGGIKAMKDWLVENGFPGVLLHQLEFPLDKPPAHVYLDDRGWQFNGTFPTLDAIDAFQPWNITLKVQR